MTKELDFDACLSDSTFATETVTIWLDGKAATKAVKLEEELARLSDNPTKEDLSLGEDPLEERIKREYDKLRQSAFEFEIRALSDLEIRKILPKVAADAKALGAADKSLTDTELDIERQIMLEEHILALSIVKITKIGTGEETNGVSLETVKKIHGTVGNLQWEALIKGYQRALSALNLAETLLDDATFLSDQDSGE